MENEIFLGNHHCRHQIIYRKIALNVSLIHELPHLTNINMLKGFGKLINQNTSTAIDFLLL